MDDPNDANGESEAVADANSMAFAASEAAAAAAAAEAQELLATKRCRICGKGVEDGRVMIHFPPVEIDLNVSQVAPNVTTFTEDLALHVFCGKTASILPNVNMPQYEVLSKAGIKNKHGIGTEVNTALARTRSATVTQPGAKEKQFYVVQEFEANLAAVRVASGSHLLAYQHHTQPPEIAIPPHAHHMYAHLPPEPPQFHHLAAVTATPHQIKPPPVRAAAGAIHKPGRRREDAVYLPPPPYQAAHTLNTDGQHRIRCACGGTHLPTGNARGAASWRSHVATKRHKKWMEDNGLMGAV